MSVLLAPTRLAFATIAALGAFAAARPAAAACALPDLAWMAGDWRADSGADRSEERWIVAPGDRLIGSSWSLHTDRPSGGLEAETIEADSDHIALRLRHFDATLGHEREGQDAPMLFTTSACAPNVVTFDGQGDRAGEHITYRRRGGSMDFIGDFIHAGAPVKVEITFVLAGS
jgi:Domain of unknown function (DUF6265)